mgnify:FL=1
MEIINAGLLSGSVIGYQIFFGVAQLIGYAVAERLGGLMIYFGIVLWTFSQTWGDLFILQMIVQSGIAFFLFTNSD